MRSAGEKCRGTKSGTGQYFTPRTLIRIMVVCVQPEPRKTITDPASGIGGFFLAVYDFIVDRYKFDKRQPNRWRQVTTTY